MRADRFPSKPVIFPCPATGYDSFFAMYADFCDAGGYIICGHVVLQGAAIDSGISACLAIGVFGSSGAKSDGVLTTKESIWSVFRLAGMSVG